MIWLFDRGGEKLQYEICREDAGQGYRLVVTDTDGQKNVQHIDRPSDVIERSVVQMRKLREDGWKVG